MTFVLPAANPKIDFRLHLVPYKQMISIVTEAKEYDSVYGFDLDGTLIGSIRENYFRLKQGVKDKLTALSKENNLVIFTNQAKAPKDLQAKLQGVLSLLDLPISIYAATGEEDRRPEGKSDERARKPGTGMWKEYLKTRKTIPKTVVFVGDAGGGATFSSSDEDFAKAIGAIFFHPDAFFEKKVIVPDDIRLILMVGYPGSGKSTLANTLGFEIVSQDVLGTEAKCKNEVRSLLKQGKKVIVDNTNPTAEKRAVYISIAKEFGVKVGVIDMNCGMLEALYRNSKREKKVPDVVFYVFRKKYFPGTYNEGIAWILVR